MLRGSQSCSPAAPVLPSGAYTAAPAFAAAPPDVLRVFTASRIALPQNRHPTPEEAVEILARLMVLKSEMSTARAYIDCLEDSFEALRGELLDQRSQNELYLTLGSIGVGAAAATAQGVVEVSEPDTQAVPILGITGGVISATLGAAALLWPSPTVWLDHEVNVLRSVWKGDDSGGLTPFVWRLLLAPRPPSQETPRAALKRRWQSMLGTETEGEPRELELLLFGNGGQYDIHALELRETMLDHLETEVDLMNQEFQALTEFVTGYVALSAASPPPTGSPRSTPTPPGRPPRPARIVASSADRGIPKGEGHGPGHDDKEGTCPHRSMESTSTY